MALVLLALLGGLALLAVAPDRFVAGSAALADRWGVSRVVIGAVVIGFGTSTPEMLVSGVAAGAGEPEVGVGNVIGSNMANIGLIIGVAALVGSLAVPAGVLRRELPLTVAATVLFAVAVQRGLSAGEGLGLLAALALALAVIVRQAGGTGDVGEEGEATAAGGVSRSDPGEAELIDEVGAFLAAEEAHPPWRFALDALAGLAGTLAGAQLLVWGAVRIADEAGLTGGFVGLTIVALGTSLPELVTAVAAARAGEDQLILGNVLGSNLFNCLAVGGIVGLAGPRALDDATLTVGAVGLMLAITALGALAMVRQQRVTRGEAVTLLTAYLVCVPLLA